MFILEKQITMFYLYLIFLRIFGLKCVVFRPIWYRRCSNVLIQRNKFPMVQSAGSSSRLELLAPLQTTVSRRSLVVRNTKLGEVFLYRCVLYMTGFIKDAESLALKAELRICFTHRFAVY